MPWWFGAWLLWLSIYWECYHPNWRTPSFFRGVGLNQQPAMTLEGFFPGYKRDERGPLWGEPTELLSGMDHQAECSTRGNRLSNAFKAVFFHDSCYVTGWWFGTWLLWLSIYWEVHNPNWLSYFSEGLKPPTRGCDKPFMVVDNL